MVYIASNIAELFIFYFLFCAFILITCYFDQYTEINLKDKLSETLISG